MATKSILYLKNYIAIIENFDSTKTLSLVQEATHRLSKLFLNKNLP